MKLFEIVGAMVALTLACGLGGMGLGYAVGTFAPNYYRATVPGAEGRGIDPAEVGMGLGLTQGMTVGFVAALGLAALGAWRNREGLKHEEVLAELRAQREAIDRLALLVTTLPPPAPTADDPGGRP